MFHLELHKFPNNMARFNLSSEQMFAVAVPWARGQWIEFGERKWNPHEARLTILEGPPIPVNQLRVGRGWRLAQRQAEDVTERVLAAAANVRETQPATDPAGAASDGQTSDRAPIAVAPEERAEPVSGRESQPPDATPATEGHSADLALLADSLGLQLLALLDGSSAPLSAAWELAQERLPGRSAGESLGLAERAVRGLLGSGLIDLYSVPAGQDGGDGEGDSRDVVGEEEVERVLRSPASWSGEGDPAEIRIRRH